MKLPSSSIKKILIFSQKKAFLVFFQKKTVLIFPGTELPSSSKEKRNHFLYFPKWNAALFSPSPKTKRNPLRENLLYFRKRKPP